MYKQIIRIENQLEKIATENIEYKELWSTWNLNKETLKAILHSIAKDYPHFSLHDNSHSDNIILNIERFLGNENIEKLSPTDLWLLLHVAYLHDLGMVIIDTKIHEIWKSKEFQEYLKNKTNSSDEDLKKAANLVENFDITENNKNLEWPLEIKNATTILISNYCRSLHSAYSKDYILDIKNIWDIDLGHNELIKKRLLSLLAEISSMHTEPFEKIYTLHKESNGFKGDYVHPRLIAVLLRVGDVLDLDNGRFNQYGEKIYGKMPKTSKIHYDKHESTKHVLITNELIEVEADCPNDEIYRETRRWYDSLKNEMDNLHLNWSDIAPAYLSYPPKLLPYKILRNGTVDSNNLSDLKFSISQSKAFEIIEGSSIYKDRFSCIREIVQNAEDASKIQLWRDIKSGMYFFDNIIDKQKVDNRTLRPCDIPDWIYKIYSIIITVEINKNNNAVLCVTDHGTGITIDTLKSICNVGQSFHQKENMKQEINDMPVWLRPTANFGIGLQSCFMATDTITIYTNASKENNYKIIFKSGKDEGYVNVEPLTESTINRGSKVEIEFNNSLNFSYDIFGFTAQNLSRIEPFETNCIIIYKIIEAVFKECNQSIFDIKVISKSINFSDKINAYKFNELFEHDKTTNIFSYSVDFENGKFNCWYENNIYKIEPNKNSNGTINVNFKGKEVSKSRVHTSSFTGYIVDIDIYGLSTKEALSLDREKLSLNASNIINEQLGYVMKQYLEILFINIDQIKDNTELINILMLTSWIFDVKFPETLYSYVSNEKNIKILSYDENEKKYQVNNCSLREIVNEYPTISYIHNDLINSTVIDSSKKEEEVISKMNQSNFNKSKFNKIFIDSNLVKYFYSSYHDITYIENCDDILIFTINNSETIYTPENHTKNILLKKLVYNEDIKPIYNNAFIMRRAIPAFNEFSKLAVSLNNIYCLGVEGKSKYKIISPISLNDYEELKCRSKESFIDYIISKETFNNLVDYVVTNSKDSQSKETIIEEYKRLIEQYYDIVSKENQESKTEN